VPPTQTSAGAKGRSDLGASTAATFAGKQIVYQIGIAPIRIDILAEINSVEFAEAWENRVPGTFFGVPVHFISQPDLESNEMALGRTSDLEDLERNPKRKRSRNES